MATKDKKKPREWDHEWDRYTDGLPRDPADVEKLKPAKEKP